MLHRLVDGFQSRLRVVTDGDAFAKREPVRLDDHRASSRVNVTACGVDVVERCEVRSRHIRFAHDRLRERLAGFELRRGRGRAEYLQPGGGKLIDDSGCERILGSNDRQID